MTAPMDLFRTLLGRLSTEVEFLPDKPEETPESTLRALWFAAAGAPRSAEAAQIGDIPDLDDTAIACLIQYAETRISGVPLAHITGRQRFMGIELIAGPEALVPRKETELLAAAAVDVASGMVADQGRAVVVDVCTGCGNVALSIAHHVAEATVFGADLSESAVGLARRNADSLGIGDRVQFRSGDLLEPFATAEFFGNVDVLTCNPPYINSVKVSQMRKEISSYEPKLAFDGGPFGVGILMRIFEEAPKYLRKGGWLAVEVGLGQGPALVKRLERGTSFSEVRTVSDHSGAVRTVLARR